VFVLQAQLYSAFTMNFFKHAVSDLINRRVALVKKVRNKRSASYCRTTAVATFSLNVTGSDLGLFLFLQSFYKLLVME